MDSEAKQIIEMGGTGLPLYDAACRAVSEAKNMDELRKIGSVAEAIRAAGKVAKNRQMEADGAEIRFRYERRVGELIKRQAETVGLNQGTAGAGDSNIGRATGGSKTDPPVNQTHPTLAEAGIDKHLADRARKYAAIPEREFNDIVDDWRRRVEDENDRVTVNLIKAGDKHVRGTLGTGENEWYTPDEYLEKARRVLGGFDLDPASSASAQDKVRAAEFFDLDRDGLKQQWLGQVWLNPPYAQPAIGQFMAKLCEEVQAGRTVAAIALTHNYTDSRWFQDTARVATAICLTQGRIKFYSPTGKVASPTQGQAFFYFGKDAGLFAQEFSSIGLIAEIRR